MKVFFISAVIFYTLSVVLFTSTEANAPTCPPHFKGLLQHPYNCYKFLQCDRGQTWVTDCGPGTVFNPQTKVCDWPQNVPGCYDTAEHSGVGIIDPR